MNLQNNDVAVSVILPVYFQQASSEQLNHLDRAIRSVINQNYPTEFELMIIDDGSTPTVRALLATAGYRDMENIRWLRATRNNGLVHALNLGLRHARHPLIARIDADDWWAEGKIALQIDRLARDRDLTIVGTGMELRPEGQESGEIHIRPDDWEALLDFSVDVGCPFPHGSILARRSIYRLLGGYSHSPRFRHCEDYTLWSQWLRFFKPGMIEQPLYKYTVSSCSVSVKNSEQQQTASREVNANLARLRLQQRLPEAMRRFADSLEIGLLEAGVICYRLWKYRPRTRLPAPAVDALYDILVDLSVEIVPTDLSDTSAATPEDLLHGFPLSRPAATGTTTVALF